MLTPTHVQLKYWMYPTGDTPAVNLLRNTPPSSDKEETIRVLCLACGDPRSILFTLWSEQGQGTKRQYSFTCCDIEPAILARNLVLLTLIVESGLQSTANNDANDNSIWNLFYHMLISEGDLEVLKEHSAKLLCASESLEGWLASSYGELFQFVNKDTLKALRKYWIHYHTFNTAGKAAAELRKGLTKGSTQSRTSNVMTGLRSAGIAWPSALKLVGHVFRRYWETGVAGGSSEACKSLGKDGKGHVNPMFAVSSAPSGLFAVHYGTDPLLGFYLAETFRSLETGPKLTLAAQSDQLVMAAKQQFNQWCQAFMDAFESRRVRIQLFFGEATTLCHELQLELAFGRQPAHPRAYSRPWCLQALRLDGYIGPPEMRFTFFDYYDVVDTSNLGDHIGLINIITVTAPLLRPRSSSTLCTESLLTVSNDATSALTAALGSDVATFSLLVGLAPSGLISDTTLEGVPNEAMFQKLTAEPSRDRQQHQYRLRVLWKSIHSSSRVRVEADQLAAWFLAVYNKMFAHEDMSTLLSRMDRMQNTHYSTDMPRYTRAAIVALIRLVRTRVFSDWDRVMDKFMGLVENDRSLLTGGNSLQELNVQLALYGVWTLPVLAEGPRQIQNRFTLPLRERSSSDGILGLVDPPPIVYVVISIPRKSLEVLTDSDIDTMGTPGIHLSIKQQLGMTQYENCFYSFHCCFGRFRHGDHAGGPPVFDEDDEGWAGTADMLIVCAVPAFGLLMGPRGGLTVSLVLNSSPANLMLFRKKLGMTLTVFETAFVDERRVLICQDPPGLDTKSSTADQKHWLKALSSDHDAGQAALGTFSADRKIVKLQIRTVFANGSDEANALAGGASVAADPIDLSTIHLKVGSTPDRRISFPFPVQSYNSKTRVARKSSWVEIEAAIHLAPHKDPFHSWTQISCMSGQSPVLVHIPRVNLDIQPIMKSITAKDKTWLTIMTIVGAMSVGEKQAQEQGITSPANPKSDLKQSLSVMFSSFMGYNPQANGPVRSFQLTHHKLAHVFIFVRNLRHDLDLGSMVLDAYVVPLTSTRLKTLAEACKQLYSAESKAPLGTHLGDEECILWKRLLPALAERCRTWEHQDHCAYVKIGKIPLSTEADENPLCSCGEGKVPPDFAKHDKLWAPFGKYATRIAIAPIFPVPYVENLADHMEDLPQAGCDSCNKTPKELKSCAACGKARYCSRECQKAAWKAHKLVCKKRPS